MRFIIATGMCGVDVNNWDLKTGSVYKAGISRQSSLTNNIQVLGWFGIITTPILDSDERFRYI